MARCVYDVRYPGDTGEDRTVGKSAAVGSGEDGSDATDGRLHAKQCIFQGVRKGVQADQVETIKLRRAKFI